MSANPYVYAWILLAAVVLVMALYRAVLGVHEDDMLHVLGGESALVDKQTKLFRKEAAIERWGQLLTVVVVVYGLALAAIYLYHIWQQGSQIPT